MSVFSVPESNRLGMGATLCSCRDFEPLATTSYDADFHAWAFEQAALLRAGRLSEIDIEHLAEEIEDMGRSEHRELENRLIRLYQHLLKWKCQPERRSASWEATINHQRRAVTKLLKQNPSLKSILSDDEFLSDVYASAIDEAIAETNLKIYPTSCPWAIIKAMDSGFWPNCS